MSEGFQKLLEQQVQKMRDVSFAESIQITLGELIAGLEKVNDKSSKVYFDFGGFNPTSLGSWRGSYCELALGYDDIAYDDIITVEGLIKLLKEGIGKTYAGYKGGDFTMSESTPIWCANYGKSTCTAIVGIIETSCFVYIETRHIDY